MKKTYIYIYIYKYKKNNIKYRKIQKPYKKLSRVFRFIDVPHSQYHLSPTAERLYDPDEFRISSKDVVQIHFLEKSGESRSSSFG